METSLQGGKIVKMVEILPKRGAEFKMLTKYRPEGWKTSGQDKMVHHHH